MTDVGTDELLPRSEVAAFALLMERKLRANDHKPGWKADDPQSLVRRVEGEVGELRRAVSELESRVVWRSASSAFDQGNGWSRNNPATGKREVGAGYAPMPDGPEREAHIEAVMSEAADVANMAMMVADVCGSLRSRAATRDTGDAK